jgi:hypothetical protein
MSLSKQSNGAIVCTTDEPWECHLWQGCYGNPPCILHPADVNFKLRCDCTPTNLVKVIEHGRNYLVHGPHSCWQTRAYLGFWAAIATSTPQQQQEHNCQCGNPNSIPKPPPTCVKCNRECAAYAIYKLHEQNCECGHNNIPQAPPSLIVPIDDELPPLGELTHAHPILTPTDAKKQSYILAFHNNPHHTPPPPPRPPPPQEAPAYRPLFVNGFSNGETSTHTDTVTPPQLPPT